MQTQKRLNSVILHFKDVFPMSRFCRTQGFVFRKASVVKSLLILVFISFTGSSFAWVFPEHRQIALLAIQNLDPSYRLLLDQLWTQATKGYSNRLTESVIDPGQNSHSTKIDYATWAAIAGDHSCSPEAMLNTVLHTEWIIKVANIAEELKTELASAKTRSQQINAMRDADIKLQRADLEYATRAGSNNVHFLLARPTFDTDGKEYLGECLSEGSPLNALGAYAWFHTSAVTKAVRYSGGTLQAEEKSRLILSALADEAFALHFLEDIFSSGHIAGTWGDASVRKGTHDYYNEKGIEVVSWNGTRMILKGDAFMRPKDAEIAAAVVQLSLEQVLDAASGKLIIENKDDEIASRDLPDSFNVCSNNFMPLRKANVKYLLPILIKTPVPGLASGDGALPRFRSELGSFLGVSASMNLSDIKGGFGEEQTQNGLVAGVEANLRFGFGLEGVLNESGDGLVFLQAGWGLDGASNSQINVNGGNTSNGITAVIPSRPGFNFRIRLPFCLLPGDLIYAGPFVYLFSHKTAAAMAIAAGNGGLIPWQSGLATSIGRFQFILGREVGVSLYGLSVTKPTLVIPAKNAPTVTAITYKSTLLEFPVFEYLPFNRSFSQEQSSSLLIQFSIGVDMPYGATVISPVNAPLPELKSVWQIGIRVVFDWRHYFEPGKK